VSEDDSRISALVAAEVFSDPRTIGRQRAPWFLTVGLIDRAFARAEPSTRRSITIRLPIIRSLIGRGSTTRSSERAC